MSLLQRRVAERKGIPGKLSATHAHTPHASLPSGMKSPTDSMLSPISAAIANRRSGGRYVLYFHSLSALVCRGRVLLLRRHHHSNQSHHPLPIVFTIHVIHTLSEVHLHFHYLHHHNLLDLEYEYRAVMMHVQH